MAKALVSGAKGVGSSLSLLGSSRRGGHHSVVLLLCQLTTIWNWCFVYKNYQVKESTIKCKWDKTKEQKYNKRKTPQCIWGCVMVAPWKLLSFGSREPLSWAIWSARCATTGCHFSDCFLQFFPHSFLLLPSIFIRKISILIGKIGLCPSACVCLALQLRTCVGGGLFYVGPSKVLPKSRVFSWDRRDTVQEQDYVKR